MADQIKRKEDTHIDEVRRTATSTVQWFAELRNKKGEATHPISHNNRLTMFICGEQGFADICRQIKLAQESIDLCCWGFDPGMELVREDGLTWPRGQTYGDLLIEAAKRGVKVRLLVWYDVLALGANNMPGYSHGTLPWCIRENSQDAAKAISAQRSIATLEKSIRRQLSWQEQNKERITMIPSRGGRGPIQPHDLPLLAREEYCASWYRAAISGYLNNIEVATRAMKQEDVEPNVDRHNRDYPASSVGWLEREGLHKVATHHQKPILIDYAFEGGRKAVAYIMGLNSITDYWDTTEHLLENSKREQGGKKEADESVQGKEKDAGFRTVKPYRDYACRLDGGAALIPIHQNFLSAWHRAHVEGDRLEKGMAVAALGANTAIPAELKKPPQAGDCSVQIIRTQPEEADTSIQEVLFQATDIATMGAGYMYIENQYFQYEPWSQRLMDSRKRVAERWTNAAPKSGKTMQDLPLMHVMIVIPVPERTQMVPRTYDALAVLGQHNAMAGQQKMIDRQNQISKVIEHVPLPAVKAIHHVMNDVVRHANQLIKPDAATMDKLRIKISVAMLNACGNEGGRWRYREIYIHSKLMLVDDIFMITGSANLNIRSMGVDSEINLAAVNPELVGDLRKTVWTEFTGGLISHDDLKLKKIASCYKQWGSLMTNNKNDRKKGNPLQGLLLPLHDDRHSNIRLG